MSRRPLYLVSGPVDWLCMGGLSLAAFALYSLLSRGGSAGPEAAAIAAAVFLLNDAHFSATNHRLYRRWSAAAQYPLTALLVPAVVLAGAGAALWSPHEVAPAFVKLFLIWSPYHYSGQTVGLAKLYARRQGLEAEPRFWTAYAAAVFGSLAVLMARTESRVNPVEYFGVLTPALGLPSWTVPASFALWALAGGWLAWELLRLRRRPHPIVLLPLAAQAVWFVPGFDNKAFFETVPFFHSLQYLLVAWFLYAQERAAESSGSTPRAAGLGFAAANGLGVFLLFWLFPQATGWLLSRPVAEVSAVCLAAVQIHHFFVDGVIWRLRHPAVSAPLLRPLEAAWSR